MSKRRNQITIYSSPISHYWSHIVYICVCECLREAEWMVRIKCISIHMVEWLKLQQYGYGSYEFLCANTRHTIKMTEAEKSKDQTNAKKWAHMCCVSCVCCALIPNLFLPFVRVHLPLYETFCSYFLSPSLFSKLKNIVLIICKRDFERKKEDEKKKTTMTTATAAKKKFICPSHNRLDYFHGFTCLTKLDLFSIHSITRISSICFLWRANYGFKTYTHLYLWRMYVYLCVFARDIFHSYEMNIGIKLS